MRAVEFIAEAEGLGCEVLTDGERVGLRGPQEILDRLSPQLGVLKPELLRVLRDGTAAEPCACICCRPDLWPKGYHEVTSTWPKKYQMLFRQGVQGRQAVGVHEREAERGSYIETREAIRRARDGHD